VLCFVSIVLKVTLDILDVIVNMEAYCPRYNLMLRYVN